MNSPYVRALALISLLAGCSRVQDRSHAVVSMQIRDKNGFSETISNPERLKVYQHVDFFHAQPYEKVLRVFGKDKEGKSPSKITSYHRTGGAWQYLEAIDGRACGTFLQWHENGNLEIEGVIIEGLADFSPSAQKSWLFDGPCTVWDEQGGIRARFLYDRGRLIGEATFYHPNGKVARIIPYAKGLLHGIVQEFDEKGRVFKTIAFQKGVKEGEAHATWDAERTQYREIYEGGRLVTGSYYNLRGEKIAEIVEGEGMRAAFTEGRLCSLTEYRNRHAEGQVQMFDLQGHLKTTYQLQDGMKTGEEWEYYPPKGGERRVKLLVTWFEDQIQGMVKTWYENGVLESQREMRANKKHGLSFAYYRSGDLMIAEEYDNGRLVSGSYFEQGEKRPVSEVCKGEGVATLYSADGPFMKKVAYERGRPVVK